MTRDGQRLGKYQIVKRLARGGMAEIFLARASGLPGFQRMVVIKRILPVLACKADFLEMFLNEARIAATLQHPNLVQMYDVGVVDGDYFIAMEYLHGEDVRSIQRTLHEQHQPVPIEHALHIAIDVCAGLHYAHEKVGFDGRPLQIVHRDVSPQNVIVTFDGAVKLLDFGVAKAANNAHETVHGVVKGKISYMSPEQCRGAPLDRRSDLFSVGIMLYELTLGRRLYAGGSEFETLKKIAEQPIVPPRVVDPQYDERLERIVMHALAKDPERRYQTARALQIDLEELARMRGMYMSAIALQQFMARVFGARREAWRDSPPPPPEKDFSLRIAVEPPLPSVERRDRNWRWAALVLSAGALVLVTLLALRVRLPPRVVAVAPPPPVVEPVTAPPLATLSVSPPVDPPPAPIRRRRPPPLEGGELVLAARPWCEVTIDGAPRGPTPSTTHLSAGWHTIRLANPAFHVDSTLSIQIAPGKTVRRSLTFPTATAAMP